MPNVSRNAMFKAKKGPELPHKPEVSTGYPILFILIYQVYTWTPAQLHFFYLGGWKIRNKQVKLKLKINADYGVWTLIIF